MKKLLLLFIPLLGFSQSYTAEKTKNKTETAINIPNFSNPRKISSAKYGSWNKINNWQLENSRYVKEKDPFEKKDLKKLYPIRRVISRSAGKKIGYEDLEYYIYKGRINSINNRDLTLKIEQSIYDYYDPEIKSKNYISLSLDNFQEMPRVLVTDTERSKWNIEDHGFEYDNEFHFYKVGDKIFNVSLSLVEKFKERHPKFIYINKIVYEEKITSEKYYLLARGIFSYMIDDQYSGQFLVNISGFNDRDYPKPLSISLNNWGVNPEGQKKNRDFINLLKKGKKLYLKFEKLWYYNGKLDSGEYDLSLTDNRYDIKSYTYEFDLTGSSKALSF